MLLKTALSILLTTSVLPAASISQNFVVKDSRQAVPAGFQLVGAASPSDTLSFRIGLRSRNVSGLEAMLDAVSTPASSQYGKYLALEEVNNFLSPSEETTSAVKSWLASNDVSSKSTSGSGDWLSVDMTVSQANMLLDADFQVFQHISSGKQIIRTLSYSLHETLVHHVDVFHPTTSFDISFSNGALFTTPIMTRSFQVARDNASSCGTTITPMCIMQQYNIPAIPATQLNNTIGVGALQYQFAQEADLSAFLSVLRPDMNSNTTFQVVSIDGGQDPQDLGAAGAEANLDVQYTVGIATGVPVSFYSNGDLVTTSAEFATAVVDLSSFLINTVNRPQVVTTSYNTNEDLVTSAVSIKLCNNFMALGALGTSVLFSSGDGGVAGSNSDTSCTTFNPSWPVGCPYITSVGATSGFPEVSANFSSGGFSNVFAQPAYQSEAVSKYLTSLGRTYKGLFNASGRAYPDVSAIGNSIEIVNGGSTITAAGTSCSSPIFASVIALVNDRLAAAGKSQLGFLNPLLYANPSAFNDITTGSNPGCASQGFPALSGWDPVTGLGTPNFALLATAVGLSNVN